MSEDNLSLFDDEITAIPNDYAFWFSPDSRLIANKPEPGGAIRISDAETGGVIRTIYGHTQDVIGLAFSPDSNLLASTSKDGTIRVWNLLPGREMMSPVITVSEIDFHPNGKEILTNEGGDGQGATVWDIETGEIRLRIGETDGDVNKVLYTPDGTRFATASSEGAVNIWDSETGKKY